VIWADTLEDGDRVRRRQAEFLVHDAVPLSLVEQLAVIDDAVSALPLVVRPDWYF
jgi:hypothetical protein